jgi:GAF domain-containing protein
VDRAAAGRHKGLLGADPRPRAGAAHGPDRGSALPRSPRASPADARLLGVPIRVHGEIFGDLYLAEKRGGKPFDGHDLDLVRVPATEAGIAIGNARLYEAAKQP